MEKDVEASELKFFIPEQLSTEAWMANQSNRTEKGNSNTNEHMTIMIRQFLGCTLIGYDLSAASASSGGTGNSGGSSDNSNYSTAGLQRAFIHQSSVNFKNASFRGSNFVLYGERQRLAAPGSGDSSYSQKIVLRDITEVSAFPLLFFGGKLETNFLDGTISVDGWIRQDTIIFIIYLFIFS